MKAAEIEVLGCLLRNKRLRAYEETAVATAIAELKGNTLPGARIGGVECEGCGAPRPAGYPLCRKCMFTLPGGVAYDVRRGVPGAFAQALEILHS